mgnify:CR=1 FL=1
MNIIKIAVLLECLYFFVYNLVLTKIILKWKGCVCVEDFRKDYIFYFGIFYLIYILVFLAYPKIILSQFNKILTLVLVPLTILYCIYLYNYINLLEKRSCDCVLSKELNAFKIYTYILIGLLIFSYIFLAIYFMNSEEYEGLIINFINNNSNVYKNVKNIKKIKNKNYSIYKNIPVNYIKKKIN